MTRASQPREGVSRGYLRCWKCGGVLLRGTIAPGSYVEIQCKKNDCKAVTIVDKTQHAA